MWEQARKCVSSDDFFVIYEYVPTHDPIVTYICHEDQPRVGKYASPMDRMEKELITLFFGGIPILSILSLEKDSLYFAFAIGTAPKFVEIHCR